MNLSYRTKLKPVWCPGCGDFGALSALTKAFRALDLPNHNIAVISGIGCSSRIAGYVDTYAFNTLHGRAVPVATGVKLAKPDLTVVAIGGDGDILSIGGGHLPHAIRSNIDITVICLNNFVYGLTKGQVSPTTPDMVAQNGHKEYTPIDPVFAMIAHSCSTMKSFIAQGIATDVAHLADLFAKGISHKGFSFISVLTECTTYRKEMYAAIGKSCIYLDESHDARDINAALALARTPVSATPHLGVFFRGE